MIVNPGLELQRHIGHTDMVATAEKIEDWVFEDLEPDELLAKCQDDAKRQLEGSTPEDQVMRSFNACLKFSMLGSLKHKEDEVSFQTRLRDDTSLAMENFTCTNAELDSSPDIDQRDWTSEKDGVTRKVHVKLERSASRIHAIENFAYPEECDAMEETAAPQLQRAAVADGKGGSIESKNRKAMQAGIVPEWEKEKDGDLVTRLSRRVYDYTNYALGLNITEHGQEPLMSIQYFGRGYNDTEPDRYTPHCDGECVGAPHIPGTRMATMVIYWYALSFLWFLSACFINRSNVSLPLIM